MKSRYIAFIFSTLLAACITKSKKVKISFLNNSGQVIDSIKISTYYFNTSFLNVSPKKTYEQEHEIKDNKIGESAFLINIFVKDSAVYQGTFGYHLSIKDIKTHYRITINSDYTITEK